MGGSSIAVRTLSHLGWKGGLTDHPQQGPLCTPEDVIATGLTPCLTSTPFRGWLLAHVHTCPR